jgi:hypothetical protein
MSRQFTTSEINTICHALTLAQEDCRRVAVKVLEHPPPSPPPALQTPDQQARARHMEETRKNLSEAMTGYASGFAALRETIEDGGEP